MYSIESESESANQHSATLPFNLKDYIDLVDWTGRTVRDDKRGFISHTEPKLLNILGLTEGDWLLLTTKIQRQSIIMFSGLESLQHHSNQKRRVSG